MRSRFVAVSLGFSLFGALFATPAVAALVPAGITVLNEMVGNGLVDQGEGLAVLLCVRNTGPTPEPPFSGLLLNQGGIDPTLAGAILPLVAYGSLAANETACRSFVLRATTTCGTPARVFLELSSVTGSGLPNRVIEFVLPSPLSPFDESFETASQPESAADWTFASGWSIATGLSDTAPNAAVVPASNNLDASLTSPPITLPAGNWTLQFRHAFDIENFWDGAALEIAIGAGGFQDLLAAGGSFLDGGYTNPNTQAGPLMSRPAWAGDSGGFITTRALLPPAAANQTIRLRWHYGTDGSVPRVGWRVDSVAITAQNCQPVSQAMPWGFRADVHANQVQFRWQPVMSPESASYRLEVSLDGGNVYQLVIPVGAATSFAAQGPDVVAHVRARAVLAGGVLGPPGLPVTVSLGSTAPPSTPRQLLATANGTTVHLAWTLEEPGGSSTAVVLEAGDAPGLANLARIVLPPGTTTFTASGVPIGFYYVRVRQQGPVLGSGASREVQLSVPGTCQAPARPYWSQWVSAGTVGNVVTLGWDLGGVGTPAPSNWLVVARDFSTRVLLGSAVVNQRRISAPLPTGTYAIEVFAANSCGISSAPQAFQFNIP